MWLVILFKKNRILEFILVTAFVALFIAGIISLINLLPENIDLIKDWGKIYWNIQDFLKVFTERTFIFEKLLELFTGMNYGSVIFSPFNTSNLITFAVCILVILVCYFFVYILSKPLFLKMASNPFEYKKKVIKHTGKNKKMRPFNSAVLKNSQIIVRTSNLIYSVVAVAIITPIAIVLQNKIIAAMDTRILGNYMGITFNILIILLLSLSSNVIIASTFSREGNSAYLNKVNPVPYRVPLSGKLVLNAVICIISIIISTIMIDVFVKIGWWQTLFLALSLVLIYLSHLLWSAEIDIMNPQNRLYQTTGEVQKNPNETKSTIIAFILSVIFAFINFFLIKEDISVVFIKLFIIATILFVIRIYLYLTKIKLYYKEK